MSEEDTVRDVGVEEANTDETTEGGDLSAETTDGEEVVDEEVVE